LLRIEWATRSIVCSCGARVKNVPKAAGADRAGAAGGKDVPPQAGSGQAKGERGRGRS
jgi:hypothetical protein